jgi:hypothetical protein
MKKTDLFLVGIVAGIVLLVVATLFVALRRPAPTYQPEDTPEGIAHNYLLALEKNDYDRAYGYLSPTLPGYPADSDKFVHSLNRNRWAFRFDEETTVSISGATITDNRAIVRATINRFYSGDLFGGGVSTSNFNLYLHEENGAWKITQADRYWANCWSQVNGCP